MKIYLLRHAETKLNEEGKMQGRVNIELSKKGLKSASDMRKELADYDIDICYTSPLIRAMQTAFTVVGDRCLIIKDDRIIERDIGEFEGEYKKDYDMSKYGDRKLNLDDHKIEKINDVYKRVEEFLDYIKKEHPDKNVLVVSHSVIIMCILNILNKKSKDIMVDNCHLEEIEL